ncbi:MAG TPA: thioredoxin domain-containing protein [Thermoanaerobaculia bacterium]|nr:thioredoxin domain-containing protein [Thermoanaerobaculia bacterium]
MKRALLALTLVVTAAAAQAQSRDPYANLKDYAAKVFPRCPGGTITIEPITQAGPVNFTAYGVTMRSSDQYCGSQKYLLHSPKSQQVVIGSVIPLPRDSRPIATRISQEASRLLAKPVTATIAPFPLADGLKVVSMTRTTPYGDFAYNGFIDASHQFLIIGFRGTLGSDPAKGLREALGASSAMRRGNASAKAEILEISDFQCPTCARAHEKMEPIIRQNLSKMNYVRIDLPLFEHHEWSVPAAMGARALQKVAPDKYWDYVDYVFKNQEEIGKRKIDDVVKDWMEDHDVDWAAIAKIYNSKTERQALLDQISRAFAIGIAATPTFVVNGQIMGFGPDGTFTLDAIKSAVGATTAPAKKPAK